jgi:hypothetical protein
MQLSLTDRARWWWLLVVVLAVASAALWWPPSREDRVVLAPVSAHPPMIANPVPSPEVGSPPAPAPIQVATPAPALKLVGTVSAGAGSFATVLHTTDSQLLQLRVGDRVDGLAVTAIEPGRLVLAGAAQPVVIEAERAVAPSAPPVGSGAVSPPPAARTEPPKWPEGEAPWDLVPPFGH